MKGRKCCNQSALKRLASIMNEVQHPSEVMCVPETNLMCSRMGHSLSHQHITIPTRLLYVITSKDQRPILSLAPLSVILTTVQIHSPCKVGSVPWILVKLHKMSKKICVTFSLTKTNTRSQMSARKLTVSKMVGNAGRQARCRHGSFWKLLSALPGNLLPYLPLCRYWSYKINHRLPASATADKWRWKSQAK